MHARRCLSRIEWLTSLIHIALHRCACAEQVPAGEHAGEAPCMRARHQAPRVPPRRPFRSTEVHAPCRVLACRYVLGGAESSVSAALHRLVHDDIFKAADPQVLSDPNGFRRRRCYTEKVRPLRSAPSPGALRSSPSPDASPQVDYVLRKHESSLRMIFAGLNQADLGTAAQLLSMFEWMTLLKVGALRPIAGR